MRWALLLGVALLVARVLRGRPAPAFRDDTVWNDGQAWPPLAPAEPSPLEIDLRPETPAGAGATDVGDAARVPSPAEAHVAWVEPFDGQCPPGYPIKAKLGSGIFHRPGGAMYERTRPDRCYASADEAVADGLRPAKR